MYASSVSLQQVNTSSLNPMIFYLFINVDISSSYRILYGIRNCAAPLVIYNKKEERTNVETTAYTIIQIHYCGWNHLQSLLFSNPYFG